MWNNGDQCAVRISEGYADYQGGTDLLRHPEVKKPDIAADGRRSRPASNRSAASAISKSSKGPESNGTARRKNSTVKTRFSSSGNASKDSRSSAVWLLMYLGYPFPYPSAKGYHGNAFGDHLGSEQAQKDSAALSRNLLWAGGGLVTRPERRLPTGAQIDNLPHK